MPDMEQNSADAAFGDVDAVLASIKRLQRTPAWRRDVSRLLQSFEEVLCAHAEAAYTEYPDDERRWTVGELLLRFTNAFKDPVSGVAPDSWRDMLLDVEANMLDAPNVPEKSVGVALRHALTRAVGQLKADGVTPAALNRLDDLMEQIATRTSDPQLLNAVQTMLIDAFEQMDVRPNLRTLLEKVAANEDPKRRMVAEGRLRVLDSRETPVDLAFEEVSGRPMDLKSLRGQVVLLQFWASWCGPCRMEIPHVRAAYVAHHDRGFEIIGISLDRILGGESIETARARVMAYIAENGMSWPNQFDGLAWDDAIVNRFGITSIPASILLDGEGRVAALNLRGDDIKVQVGRLLT